MPYSKKFNCLDILNIFLNFTIDITSFAIYEQIGI